MKDKELPQKEIMATCDDCDRPIYDDEVALLRGGVICWNCCLKRWGQSENSEHEVVTPKQIEK